MKFARTIACAALALATGTSALPQISRVGRYLYSADGTRFFVKGVAYQPEGTLGTTNSDGFPEPASFVDPLADPTQCQRDVTFLQQLGVNAIRAYSVDPTLNHDQCMSIFSQANIYTIVDLSQPVNGSIDRAAPQWTSNLLNLYLNTIDAFLKYDNVLAFTVGNEAVTQPNETVVGPFLKAAARDVKAYLKSKSSTALVTYSSTDGSDWRILLANYLSCGDDSESIDLYGLNNYEWKGDATIASYSGTINDFQNYNIPAYFSEFGSNAVSPRPFTEVAALFGQSQMTNIFSGGLAFSYFQSLQAGFGLVDISSDGKTVTPNQDFANLKQQYASVTPPNTPDQSTAGTTQFPACAQPDDVNFFGSDTLPPTPNQVACDCAVEKAFSCVFTPQTPNTSAIIGTLLDFTCGQLASQFNLDSCATALSANGSSGTYGPLSSCDPGTQLSFAMSAFYEASNRNAQSCSFAGNASVNTGAPPTESAAEAAATSCLSGPSGSAATFTPSGPAVPEATVSGSSGGSGSGSSGSGSKTGAAGRTAGDASAVIGMSFTAAVAIALGAWAVAL